MKNHFVNIINCKFGVFLIAKIVYFSGLTDFKMHILFCVCMFSFSPIVDPLSCASSNHPIALSDQTVLDVLLFLRTFSACIASPPKAQDVN